MDGATTNFETEVDFRLRVKQRAYKIDPSAWESYSGKPKLIKQALDARRAAALEAAEKELRLSAPDRAIEDGAGEEFNWGDQ